MVASGFGLGIEDTLALSVNFLTLLERIMEAKIYSAMEGIDGIDIR